MQKPPALCQCLQTGYSGAHPPDSQEPGMSFGKTTNQSAQGAKAEAICLMEKNPVGVKDLIREAWVSILCFSSSK